MMIHDCVECAHCKDWLCRIMEYFDDEDGYLYKNCVCSVAAKNV